MWQSVSENLKSLGAVKSGETVTLSFCQILKKNIFHFVHFYIDLALRCYCYCGTYSTIFMVLKHEI